MIAAFVLVFQGGLMLDSRLAKPVTCDSSLTQITDFCANASQLSGVPIRVDKGVADLKVDVFVENKPLREVLDKVAKVLNCEWVPSGDGYRFEMTVPNMNRERNFDLAEDQERRQSLETRLWAFQYIAQRTPGKRDPIRMGSGLHTAKERDDILEPYRKAWLDAQAAGDTTATASSFEKYQALGEAVNDPQSVGIGRILLQMDKSATEQFWKGQPFIGSTFSNSVFKIFGSDSYNTGGFTYSDDNGNTVEGAKEACYFIRLDPVSGALKCSLNTYSVVPRQFGGGAGSSRNGGPFSGSSSANGISDAMKKMPFYKDLAPWMDQGAIEKKFPQTLNQETKEWPSPWFSHLRRLGDHLRWFHQATGIPIVAQADRSCLWNWVKLRRGYKTAGEYLKAMMDSFETYCQEDSGYLEAKNFRYWSHRQHEAPETVWAKIEPKDAFLPFSFEQCSAVANALGDHQLHSEDFGYPVAKFDTGKIVSCYDCLRFYGGLKNEQRQSALEGKTLDSSLLSSSQVDDMTRAVTRLIFETGGCSIDMARTLATKGLSADTMKSLGFRLIFNHIAENSNWTQDLKDGDEVIFKGGLQKGPADQYSFLFGLSPTETVSQFISVDK